MASSSTSSRIASRTPATMDGRISGQRNPRQPIVNDKRRYRFSLDPTPWGTILKPTDMDMGHQTTMRPVEVALTVDRLHNQPEALPAITPKQPVHRWKGNKRKLDKEAVEQMVSRLMRDSEEHTPDTNRTMSNSPYKDVIGIFTSYQMGGWDYWH